MGSMHVHDHRHRPGVLRSQSWVTHIGGGAIGASAVCAWDPRWVGPMQRLIDGKDVADVLTRLASWMREIAAPRIFDQVVVPINQRFMVSRVLDRVARIVELGVGCRSDAWPLAALKRFAIGFGIVCRPVPENRRRIVVLTQGLDDAPDRAVPDASWQDLLLELTRRDAVLVELSVRLFPSHDRRDHQWRDVLFNVPCVEPLRTLPQKAGGFSEPAAPAARLCVPNCGSLLIRSIGLATVLKQHACRMAALTLEQAAFVPLKGSATIHIAVIVQRHAVGDR
mmetsp:Transcript_98591/g.316361  ORF Transcript_98591/g.316361 Transcript_98591/m.316361 type:complete len:281 (-) Transcript_98591:732-1574(-)